MAWVSTDELTPPASWGSLIRTTATRRFRVLMDDPEDGANEALSGTGVPGRGDVHDQNSGLFAFQGRADLEDPLNSRLRFIVNIEYQSPTQADPAANPLDDRAQVQWGDYTVSEVVEADLNGAPVLNTADDPFDPPLTRERHWPQVTITQNISLADWSAQQKLDYSDSINVDNLPIAGVWILANQALMIGFTGRLGERNGTVFYARTCVIAFAPAPTTPASDGLPNNGWRPWILNAGYNTNDGANNRTKIMLDNGPGTAKYEPTKPVPLNVAGTAILDIGSSAINYVIPDIYDEQLWSVLSLPTNEDGT